MNIILRDSSGVIKSPGYPSNYNKNLISQCMWKINAPKGQVVQLTFSGCIEIKNSINEKDPSVISRCSRKKPFTVYSTGRDLSIGVRTYYSDSQRTGFIANYTFVPAGEKRIRRVGTVLLAMKAYFFEQGNTIATIVDFKTEEDWGE